MRLGSREFLSRLCLLLFASAAFNVFPPNVVVGAGSDGPTPTYVNNTASCPGSGTSAAPYCSIQNALNNAVPGQDIRIQNTGTNYNETDRLVISGTSAKPITIEADNAASPPTLTALTSLAGVGVGAFTWQMDLSGVSYVTIQNLKWDGTGNNVAQSALEVDDGSISPVGINILNNTFTGWGASNTTLAYTGGSNQAIWLHTGLGNPDNGPYHTITANIQGNTFTGNRYCNVEIWSGLNVRVVNNTMTGTVCGIEAGTTGSTNYSSAELGREEIHESEFGKAGHQVTNTVIKGNTISNDTSTCSLTGLGPFGWSEWAAVHLDGGAAGSVVTQNNIHDLVAWRGATTAVGIHLEYGTEGITVSNNLVHSISGGQGAKGIWVSASIPGSQQYVLGNTVYNVDYIGIQMGTGNVTVENNVMLNNGSQIGWSGTTCPSCISDYNSFWDASGGKKVGGTNGRTGLNFARWQSASGGDAHSINVNPNLTNPSLGTAAGFKPAGGSAVISAGLTTSQLINDFSNLLRPSPPDMGAVQH